MQMNRRRFVALTVVVVVREQHYKFESHPNKLIKLSDWPQLDAGLI